jgi:cytochrome P450
MSAPLIDPNVLVDAAGYARDGYPHDTWTTLRRESPVHWCEPDHVRPFWALTRQAEIRHVSTHPDTWLNAPRLVVVREELEALVGGPSNAAIARSVVNMDPPEHRDYRALAAPFLKPSAVRSLEASVRALTRSLLDAVPDDEPFDFVFDLAAYHPLKVICGVLGAAEEDEDLVLRIANTVFGIEDPDYFPQLASLSLEMFEYYRRIKEERVAAPTDDLYGALVRATVDGQPIGDLELVAYFLLLTSAGHDTTRNAIAGGMHALLEHPDQLALLREDPSRCATAADEIIRWTSPVTHFCRTAARDAELAGQPIRAGDAVVVYYPSGNRDEAVFDDPFAFRVDRDPNPHLGFGVGEHFCLGAHLARMEIRVLLEELVPRLEHVERAGAVERTAASFVCGVKHLPLRWQLSPSGVPAAQLTTFGSDGCDLRRR